MTNDHDPAAPATAAPAAESAAARPRRLNVAALLNTTALLATTAVFAAVGPKLPPYSGD